MGCTMLRSHAAPDNMLDVASRRCGRTGEDGVAAGGPVRPGRRGCSMGFPVVLELTRGKSGPGRK